MSRLWDGPEKPRRPLSFGESALTIIALVLACALAAWWV